MFAPSASVPRRRLPNLNKGGKFTLRFDHVPERAASASSGIPLLALPKGGGVSGIPARHSFPFLPADVGKGRPERKSDRWGGRALELVLGVGILAFLFVLGSLAAFSLFGEDAVRLGAPTPPPLLALPPPATPPPSDVYDCYTRQEGVYRQGRLLSISSLPEEASLVHCRETPRCMFASRESSESPWVFLASYGAFSNATEAVTFRLRRECARGNSRGPPATPPSGPPALPPAPPHPSPPPSAPLLAPPSLQVATMGTHGSAAPHLPPAQRAAESRARLCCILGR